MAICILLILIFIFLMLYVDIDISMVHSLHLKTMLDTFPLHSSFSCSLLLFLSISLFSSLCFSHLEWCVYYIPCVMSCTATRAAIIYYIARRGPGAIFLGIAA